MQQKGLKMLEIKRVCGLGGYVMFAVVDYSTEQEIVRFEFYYDAVDFIRCMEGL